MIHFAHCYQNHHCYEYAPSAEVLQSAKKAIAQYNKSLQ
jgi:hypothetical protein